jgi:ethanolamine utilization protein EutP (predicted NTPase)
MNKCSDNNTTTVYDNIEKIKIIYDKDFTADYIVDAPCELFEQRRQIKTLIINDTKQISSLYSALQEEKDTLDNPYVDTMAKLDIYYADGKVDMICMGVHKVNINGVCYWLKTKNFYFILCKTIKLYDKDFNYYDYK